MGGSTGLNGPKIISCPNCLKSTPHNSNNVKAIADSGANIHLGDAQTPCGTNLNQTNPHAYHPNYQMGVSSNPPTVDFCPSPRNSQRRQRQCIFIHNSNLDPFSH
eukprot:scaffold212654_cov29-Attheya_sp.AAC.1